MAQARSGAQVNEIVQRAAEKIFAEKGRSVRLSLLAGDVNFWRKHDAAFERELKFCYGVHLVEGGKLSRLASFNDDAKTEFLELMLKHGGKIAPAAEELGILPSTVYTRLDERSAQYDHVFAGRVRAAEANRLASIREKFFWHAEDGGKGGRGNPWVQDRILRSHLPSLHNERSEIKVEGEVEHKHWHAHLMVPALQQMADQAQALLGSSARGCEITVPVLPEKAAASAR